MDKSQSIEMDASELEAAIFEVLEGKRKPGKLPLEPMVRLIAYARTGNRSPAVITNADAAIQMNRFSDHS